MLTGDRNSERGDQAWGETVCWFFPRRPPLPRSPEVEFVFSFGDQAPFPPEAPYLTGIPDVLDRLCISLGPYEYLHIAPPAPRD